MKKFLSIITSAFMAIALFVGTGGGTSLVVNAADNTVSPTYESGTATAASGKGGSATITINLPKTQGAEGNTNSPDNTTYTYKVYKVFDAVPAAVSEGSTTNTVSYSVMSGKRNSSGSTDAEKAGFTDANGMATYFTADSAYNVTAKDSAKDSDGKLTAEAAAAIAKYVSGDDAYAAVTVNAKNNGTPTTSLQITGLPYGYYYITTTTGSVVTVDTTHPAATVDDKNSVPTVTKTIHSVDDGLEADHVKGSVDTNGKNAIAEVGSKVTFWSTIIVGKGATNYVYHDKMGSGLKFNSVSSVSYQNTDMEEAINLTVDTQYNVVTSDLTDDDTFDITFNNSIFNGTVKEGSKIVIQYTAVVTSDALRAEENGNTDDVNGKNTAKVEYGNNNFTTEDTTKVYNAKIEVTKQFQDSGDTNLANGHYLVAGFVLRRGSGTEQDPYQYYKYNEATAASGTAGQEGYVAAQPAKIEWNAVTPAEGQSAEDALKAAIQNGNVTELKTTASNNVLSFTGLMDGSYTLIETTVPDGYNKAGDQTVTIDQPTNPTALKGNKNDNLYQAKEIRNQKGSLLPSTGGIGTTIFYVAGIVLVAGAAVLLINKKHKQNA